MNALFKIDTGTTVKIEFILVKGVQSAAHATQLRQRLVDAHVRTASLIYLTDRIPILTADDITIEVGLFGDRSAR